MQPRVPEPWLSFLREVDRALPEPVEVHCLGGFVLCVVWDLPRPTGDVDFVEVDPRDGEDALLRLAGEGSDLEKRYRLSFHRVTIAEVPESYRSRLIEITPPGVTRLRLQAFEVHDLVLAKLARNSRRDREDVAYLAGKRALDRRVLQERFEAELRPYALCEERDTASLGLWLDEFFAAGDP